MFGGQVVDFLKSPLSGWLVLAAVLLVPQVASFVYGLIGKKIVITAKPSAAVVEAIKQVQQPTETPKV